MSNISGVLTTCPETVQLSLQREEQEPISYMNTSRHAVISERSQQQSPHSQRPHAHTVVGRFAQCLWCL